MIAKSVTAMTHQSFCMQVETVLYGSPVIHHKLFDRLPQILWRFFHKVWIQSIEEDLSSA